MKSAHETELEAAERALYRRERREALEGIKTLRLALVPNQNVELIELLTKLVAEPLPERGRRPRSDIDALTVTVYNRDPEQNLDEHNRLTSKNAHACVLSGGATVVRTESKVFRIDPVGSARCITISFSDGHWRVPSLSGFAEPTGRKVLSPIGGARPHRE